MVPEGPERSSPRPAFRCTTVGARSPRAHSQVAGRPMPILGPDAREKAEWEGPGVPPPSPGAFSPRSKPPRDCARPCINCAALSPRWCAAGAPDVL